MNRRKLYCLISKTFENLSPMRGREGPERLTAGFYLVQLRMKTSTFVRACLKVSMPDLQKLKRVIAILQPERSQRPRSAAQHLVWSLFAPH